jgi:hypothetical protein
MGVLGALLLLALCSGAAGGEGDEVVLKSGKSLRGRVVFEDESVLILRQESRDTPIERAEIERVESRRSNLGVLLDNAARAELGDVGELELLAAQAEEMGLPGEAQVFWWRALLVDREHAAARAALGHVKRAGEWVIPVRGRMVDWDKRFQLARDWGTAWELASLHYRLRSNLPLEACLDALLDLERLYRAFYELLGAELRLYEVCRPMSVNLHADRASYPETAGEAGRYDPGTDRVLVDASRGLLFTTLAHEATHQLLQDTVFRERSGEGEIPPWLNEGLAEYVAASVAHAPNLVFEPGRLEPRHFRAHAQSKDPFDVTRVLSFSTGDFDASSQRELKYAQAYTLVHFLLHGAEGRHRAGFLDFLRAVYAGKGSPTDLKRCLRLEWRELERAWHAYARQ